MASADVYELPRVGTVLTNQEIGARFNVGNMGGMRRNTKRNYLVLISDPFKGLYQDRWVGNVLHYTGMGPLGDQSLSYAQNKTLGESAKSGIGLHLLEALEKQKYTYVGAVRLCAPPYQEDQVDDDGATRTVWMFPLEPIEDARPPIMTAVQAKLIETSHADRARRLTLEQLKSRASKAREKPATRNADGVVYVRDPAVAELAKRLAKGLCDLCQNSAPFFNKRNEAYLECHHIEWLSREGFDLLENTVALCPNCHRKMHVLNSDDDRRRLRQRVLIRDT